jgi:hypothetical protein
MTFDMNAAKQAGYSDDEINNFLEAKQLADSSNFDMSAAKQAGYSDDEIKDFLFTKEMGLHKLLRLHQEQYEKYKGEPGAKALGALQGLGRLAESLTGSLTPPVSVEIPQETPEQTQRKELFSDIAESAGALAIPLPPIGSLLKGLQGSKVGQRLAKLFEKGPPVQSQLKNIEKAAQGIKNFREREAIMKSLAEAKTAKTVKDMPSLFELAEKGIEEIKPSFPRIEKTRLGIDVKVSPNKTASKLYRELKPQRGPTASISPREFPSEAQGGRAFSDLVKAHASNSRKSVSRAYSLAEDAYKNINSIYPKLSNELTEILSRLKTSFLPNKAESSIIKSIEDLLNEIGTAERGYIQAPVSRLIRTSDSITGMANYELPFTGPKDILKKIASTLDRASLKAVERSGVNPNLMRRANRLYGEWATRFGSDQISPFLQRTIDNPEKLFNKIVKDPSTFRSMERALQGVRRSNEFMNAVAREIAKNEMRPFMGANISEVGSEEYLKKMRNLSQLIGRDNALNLDRSLRSQKRLSLKERAPGDVLSSTARQKEKEIPSERIRSKAFKEKYETPEELLKKLNTRSGIRELKKELPKSAFDELIEKKGIQILKEEKIKYKSTGKEMFEALNKEKNYELFSEIIGKEKTNELLDVLESIKDSEVTNEKIIKISKKIGSKGYYSLAGWKILKGLLLLV